MYKLIRRHHSSYHCCVQTFVPTINTFVIDYVFMLQQNCLAALIVPTAVFTIIIAFLNHTVILISLVGLQINTVDLSFHACGE